MKRTSRRDARAFDGVERAAGGGPPTAFLVWHAGDNVTDHGPTIFSKRSAQLLMAEQALRGNRYSMDVNHLSLDKSAPLENQRAVGFYGLEVRDGDLWITDCEWTDTVRGGLSKDPPEWKYFSPAYDIDKDTGEVVSFLNCALTNNPATHHVTALASRAAKQTRKLAMKWSALKAAIEGDDEDAKATAYATIAAAFPGDDEDEGGDEGEKKKDSADDEPDTKKDAAEDADEKDSADDAPPDSKKDTKATASVAASIVAEQDAELSKLKATVARLEKKDVDSERTRLIAGRQMSAELAKTLAKKSVETVREICAGLPLKARKDAAAAANVVATRGAEQGTRSQRLPPKEKQELDAAMGIVSQQDAVRREGSAVVFGAMTREQALARNATKNGVK